MSVANASNFIIRPYAPETGRVLSEDPIGFLGGDFNLYRYAFNSPLKYVDQFGLMTASEVECMDNFFNSKQRLADLLKELNKIYNKPDGWLEKLDRFLYPPRSFEVVMKDIANERALMKHYKKQFQFIRNSVNAVCSEEGERKPKSRWATKCEKDYDMFNSIQ